MEADVSAGETFGAQTPKVVFDPESYVLLNAPAREYDVAPDGERFLVLRQPLAGPGTEPPQVVIVTNWVEELKERVPTG